MKQNQFQSLSLFFFSSRDWKCSTSISDMEVLKPTSKSRVYMVGFWESARQEKQLVRHYLISSIGNENPADTRTTDEWLMDCNNPEQNETHRAGHTMTTEREKKKESWTPERDLNSQSNIKFWIEKKKTSFYLYFISLLFQRKWKFHYSPGS